MGATLDPGADFSVIGPNLRAIAAAVDATSVLEGVLGFEPSTMNSRYTVEAAGFDPDALLPKKAYDLVRKGQVVVPWVGALPDPSNLRDVYWINDPASEDDRGKFRSDANGGEAVLVTAEIEGILPGSTLVKVKFDL